MHLLWLNLRDLQGGGGRAKSCRSSLIPKERVYRSAYLLWCRRRPNAARLLATKPWTIPSRLLILVGLFVGHRSLPPFFPKADSTPRALAEALLPGFFASLEPKNTKQPSHHGAAPAWPGMPSSSGTQCMSCHRHGSLRVGLHPPGTFEDQGDFTSHPEQINPDLILSELRCQTHFAEQLFSLHVGSRCGMRRLGQWTFGAGGANKNMV